MKATTGIAEIVLDALSRLAFLGAGMVVGQLLRYRFYSEALDMVYIIIGASAVVFGCICALAVRFIRRKRYRT